MKYRDILLLSLILAAVLLAGCAGMGGIDGSDTLALRSNPPDAEVYIMERSVGRTPITVSQQALYPSSYPQDKQHLYGVIILKKAGCQDYRRQISSKDIARGVNAVLDCGGEVSGDRSISVTAAPPSPAHREVVPNHPATQPSGSSSESTTQSVKQRLREINELRDEGLIDEQEYRAIRQRILNTL